MTIKDYLTKKNEVSDGYDFGMSENNCWIGKRDDDGMWSTVTVIPNNTLIDELPENIKRLLHIS